jgi:hypothetical protein
MESPPPPLRRRLDQQGYFEATRPYEMEPDPSLRGEHFIMEEETIFYFGVEALGPYNPPITNLSAPIIIQVHPYDL